MIYLGSLQLKAVQKLEISEERNIVPHATPSGGGELLQDLGRKRAVVMIEGIFSPMTCSGQPEQDLGQLSQIIRKGDPISFQAPAVEISQVIVKKVNVVQELGRSNFYRYSLLLEEWESKKGGEGKSKGISIILKDVLKNANVYKNISQQAKANFDKWDI